MRARIRVCRGRLFGAEVVLLLALMCPAVSAAGVRDDLPSPLYRHSLDQTIARIEQRDAPAQTTAQTDATGTNQVALLGITSSSTCLATIGCTCFACVTSGTTCSGATCGLPTCSGATCGLPTCSGATCSLPTCSGATCGLPTCAGSITCDATCAGPTCFGNPTCGLPTCSGATCGLPTCSGATCAGSITCDATCAGPTCFGNPTCGLPTCSGATCGLPTCSGTTCESTCDILECPKIHAIQVGTNKASVALMSSTAALYRLMLSTNLLTTNWFNVTEIEGNGGELWMDDTNNPPGGAFYRIKLELLP